MKTMQSQKAEKKGTGNSLLMKSWNALPKWKK